MTHPSSRSPLLSLNFIALIAGQGISLFGNTMLRFAMSMWVLDHTHSASVFATILALSVVPTILIGPFGGVLADRINRRTMMVGLDLSSAMITLIGLLWFVRAGFGVPAVAIMQITLAVLDAMETPTVQAALPQIFTSYGQSTLRQGTAIINQVQQLGQLLPMFIGGVLYSFIGVRSMMLVTAACFILAASVECLIRLDDPRRMCEHRSPLEDIREAADFLMHRRAAIVALTSLCAWLNFILTGISSVGLPYIVRTVLGFDATVYGICEGTVGASGMAGILVAGLAAAKLTTKRAAPVLFIEGLVLMPVAIAFLLPVGAWGRLLTLTAAMGLALAMVNILNLIVIPAIQLNVPDSMTGKVMALIFTVAACAQPLGQVTYGWAYAHMPVWLVTIVSAITIMPLAACSDPLFRRLEAHS